MDYLLLFYSGGVLGCMPFHWQLRRNEKAVHRIINTVICSAVWPLSQTPKVNIDA